MIEIYYVVIKVEKLSPIFLSVRKISKRTKTKLELWGNCMEITLGNFTGLCFCAVIDHLVFRTDQWNRLAKSTPSQSFPGCYNNLYCYFFFFCSWSRFGLISFV